jgi:hypothetical protein
METEPVAVAPVVEPPVFDTPNILWFFGALTSATACDAVLSYVHPSHRGIWLLLASLAFLAAFAALSGALLRTGWWVPGGVLAAMAVTFVGPAGAGFERLIGVWGTGLNFDPFQEYEGSAVALVAAVAVAGLIAFALVRFHFILATVAFTTFVTLQMLVPLVVSRPSLKDHATAIMLGGAALIVVGLVLDLAVARRSAFWWHLVGLIGLTIGLAYHAFQHTSWGWVLILVAGTVVLLLGASLRRATWGVFGVAGFYAPIAHYLEVWFGNLGVAFALAALGLGLVMLGIGARVYEDRVPVFRRRTTVVV